MLKRKAGCLVCSYSVRNIVRLHQAEANFLNNSVSSHLHRC